MEKAFGFLLFLFASIINVSYSEKASFQITPTQAVVGMTGKLQCSTKSSANILTWIITKGSEIFIQYDKSFQYIHRSVRERAVIGLKDDQKVLDIEISPIQCEDDGNYSCIIKQDTQNLNADNVDWVVKDSPRDVVMSATFIDLKTNGETELVAGKPIHLLCQAQLGNPAGNLEWFIAKVGSDEEIKASNYEKATTNVTNTKAKAVEDSCQMNQKSSIKFYPQNEMKLGIKCQVKNEINTTSAEKIFKINESKMHVNKVENEKVSSTLIIIIVLAVIIPEIIIAIILGIVLYVRRKQQKKKRELEAAEVMGTYKTAAEKAAMPDRQSRNSFQMKERGSSKGGRRKRDSSLREKGDAPEKQAMTGAATEA